MINAESVMSYVYSFVVGAILLVGFIALLTFMDGLKIEYQSIGPTARHIESSHPHLFKLLYACKQHAVRTREPSKPAVGGFKGKMIQLFMSFQPEARYVRLERNVLKLLNPDISAEVRSGLVRACKRDLSFLECPTKNKWMFHPLISLVVSFLSNTLFPRSGRIEPDTTRRKLELKDAFNRFLDEISGDNSS